MSIHLGQWHQVDKYSRVSESPIHGAISRVHLRVLPGNQPNQLFFNLMSLPFIKKLLMKCREI